MRRSLSLAACFALTALAACRSAPDARALARAVASLRSDELDPGARAIESELRQRAEAGAEPSIEGGRPTHVVALLDTGIDALVARLHAIRAARESVDLAAFLWVEDDAGALVFRELVRAARRGVRVRLLVDQFVNRDDRSAALAAATHANLSVRAHDPGRDFATVDDPARFPEAIAEARRRPGRMRGSLLVVDGRLAIGGGRDVDAASFGLDPDFDLVTHDLLVIGPEAHRARRAFEAFWEDPNTAPLLDLAALGHDAIAVAEGRVVVDLGWLELPAHDWLDRRAGLHAAAEVLPHTTLIDVRRVEFVADAPSGSGAPDAGSTFLARVADLLSSVEHAVGIQAPFLERETLEALERARRASPASSVLHLTSALRADGTTRRARPERPPEGAPDSRRSDAPGFALERRELKPVPADIERLVPNHDLLVALDRRLGPEHDLYAAAFSTDDRLGPELALYGWSASLDHRVVVVGPSGARQRSLREIRSGFVVWDLELALELEEHFRLLSSAANSWLASPRPAPDP